MKKACVLLTTFVMLLSLCACAGGSSSGNDASSSAEQVDIDITKTQFNHQVTCSSLSIGEKPSQDLAISISKAYVEPDIHALASDHFNDGIREQISGWDTLPASLLCVEEGTAVKLLCIEQSVTNKSEQQVEFSVGANQIIAVDSATKTYIDPEYDFSAELIYVDANQKNDMTEIEEGVHLHSNTITLAPGESVNIVLGYAVSEKLLTYPLTYLVNPFGREESAAERLVLGYVE